MQVFGGDAGGSSNAGLLLFFLFWEVVFSPAACRASEAGEKETNCWLCQEVIHVTLVVDLFVIGLRKSTTRL